MPFAARRPSAPSRVRPAAVRFAPLLGLLLLGGAAAGCDGGVEDGPVPQTAADDGTAEMSFDEAAAAAG